MKIIYWQLSIADNEELPDWARSGNVLEVVNISYQCDISGCDAISEIGRIFPPSYSIYNIGTDLGKKEPLKVA